MLQQSNDRPNEIAHLIARLAGEEGPDHPRQKAAAWPEADGRGAEVAGFNKRYRQSMSEDSTGHFPTYVALKGILRGADAPRIYLARIHRTA